MAVMEFISKLARMLESQMEYARWREDGTQFELLNIDHLEKNVLPTYFRHQKIDSFVRQLNMYGFRKVSRRKNQMIFQHEYFVKGKDQNYHLIKRKNKINPLLKQQAETNTQIKEQLKYLRQTDLNFAELLNKLLEFKQKIRKNDKELKKTLMTIKKIVSVKKKKIVHPIIGEIQELLRNIDQAEKKICDVAARNLILREKQKEKVQQIQTQAMIDAPSSIFREEENEKFPMKSQEKFSFPEIHSFKSISNYFIN